MKQPYSTSKPAQHTVAAAQLEQLLGSSRATRSKLRPLFLEPNVARLLSVKVYRTLLAGFRQRERWRLQLLQRDHQSLSSLSFPSHSPPPLGELETVLVLPSISSTWLAKVQHADSQSVAPSVYALSRVQCRCVQSCLTLCLLHTNHSLCCSNIH